MPNELKPKMIEALEKIKKLVAEIKTNYYASESRRNQLIGYCEGLIEALKDNEK